MAKETCPVCGVIIEDGVAKYSVGKCSDLDYLAARVCQYSKKSGKKGCINNKYDSDKDYPNTYFDIELG